MERTNQSGRKPQDAIQLLSADHKRVMQLFDQFEKIAEDAGASQQKHDLVAQICTELTLHTQLEEDIFYPSVRVAVEDEMLMDEALVEHQEARELISELESMQPGDAMYEAKVIVLCENVRHHVQEEEETMFQKVREAQLDINSLGEEMAEYRGDLIAELGTSQAASPDMRQEAGRSAPSTPA